MTTEDELRRLFAEDRGLDLTVAKGAGQAVVAGARRARRRRIALSGAGSALVLAAVVGAGIALAGAGTPASVPPADPSLRISATTTTAPPTSRAATTTRHVVSSGHSAVSRHDPSITHPTVSTTEPPPPPSAEPPANPVPIGPTGYGALTLGMTAADAEATGLITPNAAPALTSGCKGYDYAGSPNPPDVYSVIISDKYGLVWITGRADAVTPENVYLGSSERSVHEAYPISADPEEGPGGWVTEVPGNPQAHYQFLFTDRKVARIGLGLATQDCYS